MTLSIEGSDSVVASAAASIATGWSEPVPGREFHPRKSSAFSRRTISSTMASSLLSQIVSPHALEGSGQRDDPPEKGGRTVTILNERKRCRTAHPRGPTLSSTCNYLGIFPRRGAFPHPQQESYQRRDKRESPYW